MRFSSKVPVNIRPGTDLVAYLAQRFTYHTLERWLEVIENGSVMLEDRVADAKDTVLPGAIITYDPGEFEEPPANLGYDIIYEDEWFLGIFKPGNLLVHRAGKSFKNNLIYQLRHVHQPSFDDVHAVNRLDRDTSGVVLVAKNSEARAAAGMLFADKAVEKEYVAIVRGTPGLSTTVISMPIGKDKSSSISYKFCIDDNGKESITEIKSCEPVGRFYSQLTVSPLTGRTHQIRVHLAAMGNPVVGDKLYGLSEEEYLRWRENPVKLPPRLLFYRQALHCRSISFQHPYLGKECNIQSHIPGDMADLRSRLECEKG